MSDNIRDEIAIIVDDAVPGDVPGYRHRYGLAAADAILARFPWIAEKHEKETRYRPDRNGHEQISRTRYVTPWKEPA